MVPGLRTVGRRSGATAQAAASPDELALLALLARHRSGDPRALNGIMSALYPSVRRFVYKLAGARTLDTHEDLIQASIEQLCRSLDGFRGDSRLSSFVFGICHRVVARSWRYDRVRRWYQRSAEDATLPQNPARADDLLERAQAVAEARLALDRLGLDERAAFVLHDVEALPVDEVARAMSCSTRTIKRRLRSARSKLLRS